MIRFKILFLLLVLYYIPLSAQNKCDYHWLFGGTDREPEIQGIQSYGFDFNISPFEVVKTDLGYSFDSMNASICDKNGNLLFYTNGCALMTADHEVMPNGEGINNGDFFQILWGGGIVIMVILVHKTLPF